MPALAMNLNSQQTLGTICRTRHSQALALMAEEEELIVHAHGAWPAAPSGLGPPLPPGAPQGPGPAAPPPLLRAGARFADAATGCRVGVGY